MLFSFSRVRLLVQISSSKGTCMEGPGKVYECKGSSRGVRGLRFRVLGLEVQRLMCY